MGKEKSAESERFRFTVPFKDSDVIAWINEQYNLSSSLRALIRSSVAKDGIVDITCKPVNPGVYPGRPPKSVKQDSDRTEQGQPQEREMQAVSHEVKDTGHMNQSNVSVNSVPRTGMGQMQTKQVMQSRQMLQHYYSDPKSEKLPNGQTDDDGFVDPEIFFQ